jgi:AcrR family transcriptional regulator
MITDNNRIWIEIGYGIFAREGPAGLRIEYIARSIGKSKSSFYHHFADLEIFKDLLLDQHLHHAAEIAHRMQQCERLEPDMLNLLVAVKEDILFQRQLRIHRADPVYRRCIERAHGPIEEALLGLWSQAIGLEGRLQLARAMLSLVVDNFYLRVTADTLDQDWLRGYLEEIRGMVAGMAGDAG